MKVSSGRRRPASHSTARSAISDYGVEPEKIVGQLLNSSADTCLRLGEALATKAVDFTSDDFDIISVWGTMDLTVFAQNDGPYGSLGDYKAAAEAKPGEIGLASVRRVPLLVEKR